MNEATEFWKIYQLDVILSPNQVQRVDLDKIYKTEKEKYDAVVDEIEQIIRDRLILKTATSFREPS